VKIKFVRVRHREVIYLRSLISEVSTIKGIYSGELVPQVAVYSFARSAGEQWQPVPTVEIRGLRLRANGKLSNSLSATFHKSDYDGRWESTSAWEPPSWLDEIFELERPPFSDVPMLRAWLEQHGAVLL
jgi:hypothetical protein